MSLLSIVIAVRFVHLGAATLLVGAFAFLLVVAWPAFRHGGGDLVPARERFDQVLLRLAGWSAAVAFIFALGWLWLQAAIVTGQPLGQALTLEAIGGVLTKTQFGRVWQLRLGLIALLGGLLLFREREHDERDWVAFRAWGLVLGGGVIAGLAWAGHAAATQGPARYLHLGADAIHLLAVGSWLGGLVPLALLLTRARRSLDPAWAMVSREVTRRFSTLALVSVACLVFTGVLNTSWLVGDIPRLLGTPYGRLLLIKLALLVPLIAFAAVNLLRLKPRLAAGMPAGPIDRVGILLGRLRNNVIGEASLGAAILLVVGALGVTAPGRHIDPWWPFGFRLNWAAVVDLPSRVPLVAGAVGIELGVAALVFGLLRRQYRRWAISLGLALAGVSLLPLRALSVDAYPTTFHRPAVRYSTVSVANGARLYERHCGACHGVSGYGDGPAAMGLARKPADLTAKHTADHTAGDLFWWLSHGIKGLPMPGFGDRLDEEERWDLVNFLRALASAEQARPMAALVESTPWLVAPDFTFGIGVGAGQTLKEDRGEAIVHLILFTIPGSLSRLEQLDNAWSQIAALGARAIAVPMRDAAHIYRALGMRGTNFAVVVDGSEEIVETYTLFRRTLAQEGLPPIPPHMEFLIDRQGYVRARWIAGEGTGWSEIPRLLQEVGRLAAEAPRVPAPDEHVH